MQNYREVQLRLPEMAFAKVGLAGSATRQTFEALLVSELAPVLGVSELRLSVQSVTFFVDETVVVLKLSDTGEATEESGVYVSCWDALAIWTRRAAAGTTLAGQVLGQSLTTDSLVDIGAAASISTNSAQLAASSA